MHIRLYELDEGKEEIQALRKQNEVLWEFVKEVVGLINPAHPKMALKDTL